MSTKRKEEVEEEETEEWNAEGERVYINQHPLAGRVIKALMKKVGRGFGSFIVLLLSFIACDVI